MTVSVVIPNWQGAKLLKKNLPHVVALGASEVIVVENGSTDGSLELLKTYFPKVKVIVNQTNEGFAKGVNRGVKEAKGDIIILLNTDVIPEKGLLKYVLPHFKDNNLFAVTFNEGVWSWARGYFNKGLIEHSSGEKTKQVHDSFWASGGSAAFDKKKWDTLGGFNLMYEPFYWEDVDLSYQAQKRGWRVLWDPQARVEHKHEVTVQKHSLGQKKELVSQRNQILFFWANITSPTMWVAHIMWMPVRLLSLGYWKPFLWALTKLPQVLKSRTKGKEKLSDETILERFS